MKNTKYFYVAVLFAAFLVGSCQKEVVRPVSDNSEEVELVSKNDDGSASDEGESRANKDGETNGNSDDTDKDGKVVVSGNNIKIIDNITDPNNDEDDKGKIGIKK